MTDFNREVLAENIRMERARVNKSREAISDETGISPGSLGDYESSRTTPNVEAIWKLADVYDKSIDELVGRTPPEQVA